MATASLLSENIVEPYEAIKKVATNITGLDEILNGGIPVGAMTLLVCSFVASAISQGEKVFTSTLKNHGML